MTLDAVQKFSQPLTKDRLFGWHACLFPAGRSGMYKIKVGSWRDDKNGPMQVVSGALGSEKVHFKAPAACRIDGEMKDFFKWFNGAQDIDAVLKAAIAHLWFVTIHPFEDGNGRIGRALSDMQLTRSDNNAARFYSMSVQIRKERGDYYKLLEKTQTSRRLIDGKIDITDWLEWFLGCLGRAFDVSNVTLASVLKKASFWENNPRGSFNERQQRMIEKLLDGFIGKLTSSKWARIVKCSQDTALRDISFLVEKGILVKDKSGGRSTSYSLKGF